MLKYEFYRITHKGRRHTPLVPVKILFPLIANDHTRRFVNPLLTAFQLDPLSVERNMPPLNVPAKILSPLIAVELTF
jgi:hypothetical protein